MRMLREAIKLPFWRAKLNGDMSGRVAPDDACDPPRPQTFNPADPDPLAPRWKYPGVLDDESYIAEASASLGMGTRMLPSNRYRHPR